MMYLEHDPGCRVVIETEDAFKDPDHEFHRCVVVVQQDHPEQWRALQLRRCLLYRRTVIIW